MLTVAHLRSTRLTLSHQTPSSWRLGGLISSRLGRQGKLQEAQNINRQEKGFRNNPEHSLPILLLSPTHELQNGVFMLRVVP